MPPGDNHEGPILHDGGRIVYVKEFGNEQHKHCAGCGGPIAIGDLLLQRDVWGRWGYTREYTHWECCFNNNVSQYLTSAAKALNDKVVEKFGIYYDMSKVQPKVRE